jgi:hypothetical protein
LTLLAVAGCGGNPPKKASQAIDTRPGAACGRQLARPDGAHDLPVRFRAHGVPLQREEFCFTNADVCVASTPTGSVICSLFAEPLRAASGVRRTHYDGEQETTLDFLNVQCTVYPNDPAHAEREIAPVIRALLALTSHR